MLYEATIQLETVFLAGGRPDKQGVRRLHRLGGLVAVDKKQLGEQMVWASSLIRKIDPFTVVLPANFDTPATELHRRCWGGNRSELFEAIPKKTSLLLEFATYDEQPGCPDEKLLTKLLNLVGRGDGKGHGGMSQFGAHFGYGRFTLTDLKTI